MDLKQQSSSPLEKKYKSTLDFLFAQLPMFSRVGAAAYKPGLERSIELDNYFDNPHRKFNSIHIAGTNGKGSVSHMTAATLQAAGYKVGLYTSPHLVDFRERIRVNGIMIPQEEVINFVDRWRECNYTGDKPSFFELTMMMAFDWFARSEVDYAVIEVGMGGRLDSTNIITPILCAITNISFDHMQFLGDNLSQIASEKAGIIKSGIPVIIGEAEDEVENVFITKAQEINAPITLAYANPLLQSAIESKEWGFNCKSEKMGDFFAQLGGEYQKMNINTVLHIINKLRELGIKIDSNSLRCGLSEVENLTGLKGRWMKIANSPLTICDTGHNEAGLKYNLPRLQKIRERTGGKLRILMGFVADKDVIHILNLFPKDAIYYITQAAIPRAMKSLDLYNLCLENGFEGNCYNSVADAYKAIIKDSQQNDVIYIGGSTFIVADFLAFDSL